MLFWPESVEAKSTDVSLLLPWQSCYPKHLINLYKRLYNNVCPGGVGEKVSGEVFLPHSAGLLAPCLARALLPESTQG